MSAFIDQVKVAVKAGSGGDGMISFRREKYVDRGGPDGGDGGRGGDVVAVATRNLNTLQGFRHKQILSAEAGGSGEPQKKHGRNGQDLLIKVPVGTAVKNGSILVADLNQDGQTAVIAEGGHGGFGNAHFTSSIRQTPRLAEKGEPGQNFEAVLELKLLADVGLVGLPNAGKSTFLSVVSNARPEIADYPFTTLVPNLGVADVGSSSLLIADIPGLIEGASEGKGLGDAFLRHVERTAVLLHLIDAYSDDVVMAYLTIQQELKNYIIDLSKKPQIIALTKVEGLDDEIIAELTSQLKKATPKNAEITAISASAGIGLQPLLNSLARAVKAERAKVARAQKAAAKKKTLTVADIKRPFIVEKQGDGKWLIKGEKIERFARRTDFDNDDGVRRLQEIMRKTGITKELSRLGAKLEDKIYFLGVEDNSISL